MQCCSPSWWIPWYLFFRGRPTRWNCLCVGFLLNVNRNKENKDVSFVVPIYTQLIKKSNENSRWLPVKLSQVELKCIVFRSDEYTRSKMFRSHDDWQILSRPIIVIFFYHRNAVFFKSQYFFIFQLIFIIKSYKIYFIYNCQ